MSETSNDNLTDKERNIVNLINSLAEAADDETTTQEAIDRIVGQIKSTTSESIKDSIERAEKVEEEDEKDDDAHRFSFPAKGIPNGIPNGSQKGIESARAKMMEEFFAESSKSLKTDARPHQVFFTRIREVKAPAKAHPTDAGIDFFVPDLKAWTDEYKSMVRNYSRNPADQDLVFIGVNGVEVAPGAHVAIPSGIKTIIPTGLAMMMVNKSGVATKMKLDHSACLIDSEYRDELIFCFFNNNQERIVIEPGMKLTQGLIVPVYNVQMQEVLNCVYEDLGSQTNRGGGFGSSGCC